MKRLRDAFGSEWVWTRPEWRRRRWELRAGDEVLAVLENGSLLGLRMRGETADGRWELVHEGFFSPRALLRPEGGGTPVAVVRLGAFGGGVLEVPEGEPLRWGRGDFWGRRWRFRDADGHDAVTFVRRPAFFKSATAVEVAESFRTHALLPPLVLLGFFVLRLLERQSHAS